MNLRRLLHSALDVYRRQGPRGFLRKSRSWIGHRLSLSRYRDYRRWLSDHQRLARAWYAAFGREVAIVIPSYNDSGYLQACLESLKSTLPAGRTRIFVVDDCSPDPAHQRFLDTLAGDRLEVLRREQNGGFAKAANTGLREARKTGLDVILLNSDIVAKPAWLESLQYGAYREEQIGICGPKLLYPDGSIQSAGSHRNEPGSPWFDHYYRFKPASYAPANIPVYCQAITGACIYIKREVIEQVGLLDEAFGMAFEDVDYCLRAWRAGYRSYYWPYSELVHHESVTRGREPGPRENASQEYFWKKWGKHFDARNVRRSDGSVRVIYVMEENGVAGGHRNIFDQLNRLKKQGYDAELWALEDNTSWFDLQVPVRVFQNYETLSAALAPEEAIKVATWWKTGKWVWLASIEKGIPAWLVQDIESSYYAGDPLRGAEILAGYRREFHYFTICQWNVERLRDLDVAATLLPCGIDLSTYRVLPGTRREKSVLVTSGRANPLKNLPLTLDAWKRVTRNPPELWMYGIEPELARGLKNARYFDGLGDEGVNELLNRATAFLLTSRHEGFALTILEAMAAGCPVICTDADGNRDFCVDGVNCLMLGKEDAAGLALAVERLFSDPELQERLRKEGFKTALAYDWDTQVRKLIAFFAGISGIREPDFRNHPANQDRGVSGPERNSEDITKRL